MEKENNYAFIDSQNLNLSVRSQGWRLDFGRFRKYLEDKYQVTQAFLFIGFVETNQPLYTELQKNGYIVVFKPAVLLPDGKIKGNVDAELVLRTMIEYPNYHQAVIVTGDGDFYCLVEYLIEENKLKRLLIPNRNHYSALFRKFIVRIDYLNDLRQKMSQK